MENKKKYNRYNKNNYYNSNKKSYKSYNNINNTINYSNSSNYYKENKDQEIERLLNIIETLKAKNSSLIQENKYLKLQIKQLKSEKKNSNDKIKFYQQPKGKNCIYAEYIISDEDINKDIRILNHDEIIEDYDYDDSYGCNYYTKGTDNQEEIEDSCTIYFGKKPIKFTETFNFNKPGKYSFIFEFKYKLSNISHLFKDCDNLLSVDFSHFDSSGIKEFGSLFENCLNLKYIDLSNIYLPSVNNADNIFYGVHNKCRLISKDKSLINTFEKDKVNFEHKDDWIYNDDYD